MTTIETPSNDVSAQPEGQNALGELPFSEYVKARRTGETPEAKAPSAPEAKKAPEQKKSTESDTEETEGKAELDAETDSDEEEVKADSEQDKDKPKKRGGFQRRIDKLNARVSERERELEYWKQLALKEKQGAGESKTEKVETQSVATEGKPIPDQFETHQEYVEALTEWKTEQKLKEREQRLEKSKLEAEQEKVFKSHSERVKSFAEKTEDFAEVLSDVDDIPVSPTVQQIIITSENGPELMYELAKNREEYARICQLSPLAAAREMGRLESKLIKSSEESKVETKKLTSAPKPLQPVGKSSSASISKSIDDPGLSFSEYVRIRREQQKRKRGI
jgi:hypothetical protein